MPRKTEFMEIKLYKKAGRLTKISDNDNALRFTGVVGLFYGPPLKGYNFTMYSEPLTPGMEYREVSTSPIAKVEVQDSTVVFHTMNSRYMLEIFGDAEEEV